MSDDNYTPTSIEVLCRYQEWGGGSSSDPQRKAEFERFLAAIRAEQREADAVEAESDPFWSSEGDVLTSDEVAYNVGRKEAAAAIRATGEQPGNVVKVDPKLDPEPWNVSYNGVVTNRTSIYKPRFENGFGETVTRIFAPAAGFSQNPADYSIPSDPEQKAGK